MKNTNAKLRLVAIFVRQAFLVMLAALFLSSAINAQTTLFTFQGKLPNDVTPATDTFEMEFKLFDAATDGTQISTTNLVQAVEVKSRAFTVQLDFGAAAFSGADRFIEISYRRNANQPFTTLAPRQQVLSVPYAIRSLTATTADNALNLNGVDASNYVQTTDSRLSDSRDPNPGSNNYIQNTTSLQTPANFNISGNGTANSFNAATQYNLGGNRILSIPGTHNLFVGLSAGSNTTTGSDNSFFGKEAGSFNSVGVNNSFFGRRAGISNTGGGGNTFVGSRAGLNNTIGSNNTFIGTSSGFNSFSTPGSTDNTLIGSNTKVTAGVSNSTAIGANTTVSSSDTIVLGTNAQTTLIPGQLNVNDNTVKTFDNQYGGGLIAQTLAFRNFEGAASVSPLCFRSKFIGNGDGGYSITNCDTSSSSLSYKTDLQPFTGGLDIINRLKPFAFRWKEGGERDFGLNAEDVAEVAPLLITRNSKGEVKDVNANSLNVLFINAFKEQQAQIKAQQEQLRQQQQQIDALKKLVCQTSPQADGCKYKEQ